MSGYKIINANNLGQIDQKNSVIIDVRTLMEHGEKHLKIPHQHVPLDELDPKNFIQKCAIDKKTKIYVICRSGGRARKAAEKFAAENYENVFVIDGGLTACENCGHKVEGHASKKSCDNFGSPISLERQVRIAAGVFTFIGAFFALIFNPIFALIPLFIGGGLIFAGITDRCGLALVLTKAPWNKSQNSAKNFCESKLKN
jgi:rhodanese-related sulfurtransferase